MYKYGYLFLFKCDTHMSGIIKKFKLDTQTNGFKFLWSSGKLVVHEN